MNLIDKIKNGEIKQAESKNDQIKFKSNLGEIKKVNNKKRSKEQEKGAMQYWNALQSKKCGY